MRQDARDVIERTLDEIKCGARTLDPATEIDIALTAAGLRVMKISKVQRHTFVDDTDEQ